MDQEGVLVGVTRRARREEGKVAQMGTQGSWQTGRRRGIWASGVAVSVAVLSGAVAIGGTGLPATAQPAATPTPKPTVKLPHETGLIPPRAKLSGVHEAEGRHATAAFGTWRGRKVTVVTDFLGSSTWKSITDVAWTKGRWQGRSYHYVWSVPMLPKKQKASMKTGARGGYNNYFTTLARGLVRNGFGSSTLRVGWENTGWWYPWDATKNPTAYAAFYRQIVTTMRKVPGAHFTFEWNISNSLVDPRRAYPGDRYVDYIGGDFYDMGPHGSYDHAGTWRWLTRSRYGLNWTAAYAKAHHKRFALSEWALSYGCGQMWYSGDDPSYITNMRRWINSHDVAYETYFDDQDSRCHSMLLRKHFPKAAMTYRRLW